MGRALDVIGDRWTLVLVRHLLRGPCGFQELRVRCGIAPRVLSSRLRDLTEKGFIQTDADGSRPVYSVTERGRSLEPIISSIARWYLHHGLDDLDVDATKFSDTSARSVLESLPALLREERAAGVDLTFEIRLTGSGGGVWTVRIVDGGCTVVQGFAEQADVRYTADARTWCAIALGIADASEAHRTGKLAKDGGSEAMDHFFFQIARTPSEPKETQPHGVVPSLAGTRRRPDKGGNIMISFALTEEQTSARDAMQGFASEVLRPIAREYDEASAIPDSFFQQSWELGLTATQIPEAYGGYGAERSPFTNAVVLEELAYGDATLAIAALSPSLFANAVADQGTDEQKQRFLPAFCGEKFHTGSLAMAESAPGFDPFRPSTKAEKKGSGYTLYGEKRFVPLGNSASDFLVVAQSDEGLDAFIVPAGAPGLTVGEVEKNLGLKALPTTGLRLDGVDVGAEQRLGGASGADVRRIINQGRVAIAAILTGLSRGVLDYCVPYSKERVAFDEPIARKQSIAFRLGGDAHRDRSEPLAHLEGRHRSRGRTRRNAKQYSGETLRRRKVDVDRRQRGPSARRSRLHPRTPSRDVVPQRAHTGRPRGNRIGLNRAVH